MVETEGSAQPTHQATGVAIVAGRGDLQHIAEEALLVGRPHVGADVGTTDQEVAMVGHILTHDLLHGEPERLIGYEAVAIVALQPQDEVDHGIG